MITLKKISVNLRLIAVVFLAAYVVFPAGKPICLTKIKKIIKNAK